MSHSVRYKFVWTRASRGPKAFVLCLVLLCLGTRRSEAQIYSWKDTNGNLVLSNRRPAESPGLKSYAVPSTTTVRATRYAAVDRSRLYDDLIVEHAKLNGVRSDLVRAVVQVESAFNPTARSPKGALGLMQLMPSTMKQFGVVDAFNPVENVRAGVAYLRELLDRYQNNEELALAAYNAGPGAVDKHGQTIPPYKETRNYVAQINQMASRPVEMRSSQIYKVVDIVDGQPVVRYTDRKPATGSYELVSR
ncbi:MAG TPA: lytic transglycosylase domain-containing protein [Vicinamibacterales bacterium]|jgi:soluble lytic murein transglycosylase-like protein